MEIIMTMMDITGIIAAAFVITAFQFRLFGWTK